MHIQFVFTDMTHMNLSYTESVHQSTKHSIDYLTWQWHSKLSGKGLLHHLLPDPFHWRFTGISAGFH